MKWSGRQAQKSRHADERLSNFREHPRNSCQAAAPFLDLRDRIRASGLRDRQRQIVGPLALRVAGLVAQAFDPSAFRASADFTIAINGTCSRNARLRWMLP